MARRARLNRPGGVFHVVSRFARDEWLLDRPGAREAYLQLIGRAAATSDVEVLGYCLMSNHVHLVLIQGEKSLERFMKSLNTGFAAWLHKGRDKPRGPIFTDRPRLLLVEREPYLLELIRYIHNNPVRAQVARFARSSAWSSHQAYLGRVAAPEWLRTHHALKSFGRDAARAAARFDAYVTEASHEPRRPELSGAADAREAALARRNLRPGHRVSDGILGSEAFVSAQRSELQRGPAMPAAHSGERRAATPSRPSLRDVLASALRLLEVDAVELEQHPGSRRSTHVKRLVVWAWLREYRGHQIDVARALALETSTVSRYYGQALIRAPEFDQRSAALSAVLSKRRRARSRHPLKSNADPPL
jgi:REP element-mobilizing transposase RayT